MKVTCAELPEDHQENILDWAAMGALTRDFPPVDGGLDKGCRRHNFRVPFDSYYYMKANITSLDECKSACRQAGTWCTGLEYLSQESECRLWRQIIDYGEDAPGSICLRHDPEGFEPVGEGSGEGEACIGTPQDDGLEQEHSTVLGSVSLHECKVQCALKQSCSGVEYRRSDGRCRVWMLAIANVKAAEDVVCLRYTPPGFLAQDGGVDRACRGRNETDLADDDNSIVKNVSSLYECQTYCARTSFCYGISYNSSNNESIENRCEIWTQRINSTVEDYGSTCLAFEPQPSTSLLCAAIFLPWTVEPQLLEMELKERMNLFSCEGTAVYSDSNISLGDGLVVARELGVSLHCPRGGPYGNFQNTPIFISFWDHIIKDGEFKSHAWTVKVDPDAVFFPGRLRDLLLSRDNLDAGRKAVFLNNCQLGLHGPIEIVSRRVLELYYAHHDTCWYNGQEDVWIEQCLQHVGAEKVDQWDILAEKDCWRNSFVKDPDWYLCESAHVSFHPFKSPGSYKWCFQRASELGQYHWTGYVTQ